MQPLDLIVLSRWVMPIEPAGLVIEHGGVAIDAGRIVAVDGRDSLLARLQPKTTLERPTHVLLAGLVNAHTHAAMSLLRDAPPERQCPGMAREIDLASGAKVGQRRVRPHGHPAVFRPAAAGRRDLQG